jgi:putative ABC transport system permease protein
MLGLASKNISKRKIRAILTVLGIMMAIQLYVLLSSVMSSYDQDIKKQVENFGQKIIVQDKDAGSGYQYPPLNSMIEEDAVAGMMDLSYVDKKNSSPVLFQEVAAFPAPNMPPSVLGVGIACGKERAFFGDAKIEGQESLKSDNEAILGQNAARHYKVKLGGEVTLNGRIFKVVGLIEASNRVINGGFVISLPVAQEIFTRPKLISCVLVNPVSTDIEDSLAKSIEKSYGNLSAITSNLMKKSADSYLLMQRLFFTLVNASTIISASIIIMIVMVMAIYERRKEIGTLKAIGASKRKIFSMIAYESIILSLIGCIPTFPISAIINKLIFRTWIVDPLQWVWTILVAVVLGLIASLIPTIMAVRVSPVESLRYE